MSSTAAGVVRAAVTAAVVVAIDQIGKQIIVASISRGEVVAVFPGLDLTNTRNPGVAFGALAGGGALVAVLIGVSLAVLIGYFASHVTMPWLWLPVGLLVGGALGNLIDRVREGSVVDYIDPVAWPAFNIADSCIVVGVIVLLFVVDRNQRHAAAAAAAADEGDMPKP